MPERVQPLQGCKEGPLIESGSAFVVFKDGVLELTTLPPGRSRSSLERDRAGPALRLKWADGLMDGLAGGLMPNQGRASLSWGNRAIGREVDIGQVKIALESSKRKGWRWVGKLERSWFAEEGGGRAAL